MKKTQTPVIILLLSILLTACAAGTAAPQATPVPAPTDAPSASAAPTPSPTAIPTAAPTAAPAPEQANVLGEDRGDGNYENAFLGVGCRLTEEWTFASRERLEELGALVPGMLPEEMPPETTVDLAGIENAVYAMYASSADGRDMSLTLEKLDGVQTLAMDPTVYVELAEQRLPDALRAMGMTAVHVYKGTAELAGQTMSAVRLWGVYNGTRVYETIAVSKQDEYMAVFTFASQGQDLTEEMLSAWYILE